MEQVLDIIGLCLQTHSPPFSILLCALGANVYELHQQNSKPSSLCLAGDLKEGEKQSQVDYFPGSFPWDQIKWTEYFSQINWKGLNT